MDVDGVAALHVASTRNVTEALLRAGADPNARGRDGRTPLHEACERGDGWATEALLGLGAAPNAREKASRGGRTPLHVTGDWRCARALCAAGADAEATADVTGWTPLQTAAAEGKAEVVRTLLEAGARVNARTSVKIGWGKTAADLARERGHREVTRLLGGGGAGGSGGSGGDDGGLNERGGGDAPNPTVDGSNPASTGEYPHGARAYAQYARAPHAKAAEAYPEGSGGVFSFSTQLRRFASSRALLAFVVVTLLLLVGGLSAIRGMRNELAEWRALREKKAARREKAEKAAAFKKSQEEEAARRRAVLAEAEVARVLACPAVVTEAATKAAEEAKAKGEPKPRKDHSAVHRCVLDLGGPGTSTELRADSEKGGDPSRCVVCAEFLADVAEKVKIELAGSGSKDGAGTADRVLGTACGEAQGGGNSRHGKLCDSLLTLRKDVARPLGLGVPPRKICERVSQKDSLICELKAAKEGTVGAEGGDVAAGDAFKRISLLVHPDKHRGHHGAKANAAFRLLKQARDHFDMKAKREAERLKKEEGRE